jgi:RNA recognition motif-containing protein
MRGQAHIVMADEETAETAIKALRGYFFYGKPLRANFAKTSSDMIAKLKGSFDEGVKDKRKSRQVEEQRMRDTKIKRKQIDRLIRLRKQCD